MDEKHTKGYDVVVSNQSDRYGQIALQGPEAQNILQQLTKTDLEEIAFYRFKNNVVVDA